jgi:lipopolysaccharide transport system ATP-binding protein
MSDVISIENVSKLYRLGETDRKQFFGDIRRWVKHKVGFLQGFGNPLGSVGESSERDIFWALKDINFTIRQGETVAFIGPNGAGKSTLLKIISRITAPTKGVVRIRGRVGSLLEIGTGFHPDLTGRENVYLNGAIFGMSRSEVKAKFDDIVSFSGIEKFIDTPVKRYSSGMFVRLAFSVAAFLEPEILIIDEVLSVGDQQFQNKCLDRIKDIIKDGRTFIFVSHGAETVAKVCKRAVYLKQGQVVFDGDAMAAIEEYYTDHFIDTKSLARFALERA